MLYSISRRIPFLNGYHFIMKNTLKIDNEKIEYMETLIKLDMIAGITSIFGIRDEVRKRHWERIDEFEKIYKVDIRRHIHIGGNKDPNRKRLWEPPLNQTPKSWHFDLAYMRGNRIELLPGEFPIFHVDRPNLISVYIDFIFEELVKNGL